MNTRYDVVGLEKKQKQELFCLVLFSIFAVLLLVTSIVCMFTLGDNLLWFFCSTLCATIALLILYKQKKRTKLGRLKTRVGIVKKLNLRVNATNGILTVGYGGTRRARYSDYGRDINVFTIYIDDGDKVCGYTVKDTSKRLESYYQVGDEVIHIGGCRFPVKPNFYDLWLCPVCGEFNDENEKVCHKCKNLILL